MDLERLIARGGSKLEITKLFLENEFDIAIPRSAWKYYGGSLDPLLSEISRFERPLIVRGSHRNDYHGFIDVIPTIKNVSTKEELERAIRAIEKAMKQESVKIHCEDWNQPYTPEAHILVQEQIDCSATGFMLRHPHTGSLCMEQREAVRNAGVSFARLGENYYKHGRGIYCIDKLSALYERIEAVDFLEQEWVHQVEYGINSSGKVFFFQARPFKRRQAPAAFEIKVPEDEAYIYVDDFVEGCFGITPQEGIELDFFNESKTSVHKITDERQAKPYGLIIGKAKRLEYPIWTRFGNMQMLALGASFSEWQSHENYRFVKRAEYTMLSLMDRIIFPDSFPVGKFQGRYISNGREGLLVPT